MHAYRDFIADNDCAIFIQIPGLFKRQRLKNVILTLHVLIYLLYLFIHYFERVSQLAHKLFYLAGLYKYSIYIYTIITDIATMSI